MSSKKRVFVVQRQFCWDRSKSDLVPKYDLDSAGQFGELVYLLSPTASPFSPSPLLADLHTLLADFGDDDHLLLVGNPVLIGLVVAVAADFNRGRVKLLQWHGRQRAYRSVEVTGVFAPTRPSSILSDDEEGSTEPDQHDESRYNR